MADFQFVTEQLAVGSSIRSREAMREIARTGITHVVNMQIEFDNRGFTDGTGVQVLWNGCDDDFMPKPAEWFWNGVQFTLEALQNPRAKVLFHCAAGIHRSPLMLLTVLRVLGYEAKTAAAMILAARPEADFPPVYLESVEDFVAEYNERRESKQGDGRVATASLGSAIAQ